MANALLKLCAQPGCPTLTTSGRCPDHGRQTAARRGYNAGWQGIRARFRRLLIAAGIAPVCGARLPTAPLAPPSQCQASGQLVDDSLHTRRFGSALHTDHIVPHGGDRRLFTDVNNLQLLCRREHAEKTAAEERHGV